MFPYKQPSNSTINGGEHAADFLNKSFESAPPNSFTSRGQHSESLNFNKPQIPNVETSRFFNNVNKPLVQSRFGF